MSDANSPQHAAHRRERPVRQGAPEGGSCRIPPATVAERDGAVAVTVDLPEFDAAEIDLLLSRDLLYVEANRSGDDGGGTAPRTSARTVALPAAVDETRARASLDNGILIVTLPAGRTDPDTDSTWIAVS